MRRARAPRDQLAAERVLVADVDGDALARDGEGRLVGGPERLVGERDRAARCVISQPNSGFSGIDLAERHEVVLAIDLRCRRRRGSRRCCSSAARRLPGSGGSEVKRPTSTSPVALLRLVRARSASTSSGTRRRTSGSALSGSTISRPWLCAASSAIERERLARDTPDRTSPPADVALHQRHRERRAGGPRPLDARSTAPATTTAATPRARLRAGACRRRACASTRRPAAPPTSATASDTRNTPPIGA